MKVQFRTGERAVPDHLATAMTGMETYKMTFDEAVAELNRRQMGDYFGRAQRSLIRGHLETFGRGRDN